MVQKSLSIPIILFLIIILGCIMNNTDFNMETSNIVHNINAGIQFTVIAIAQIACVVGLIIECNRKG